MKNKQILALTSFVNDALTYTELAHDSYKKKCVRCLLIHFQPSLDAIQFFNDSISYPANSSWKFNRFEIEFHDCLWDPYNMQDESFARDEKKEDE